MSLKEAVKRECRKRNMTQADLAFQLDMKPSNFNNQIGREETVQLGLIRNICKALDIDVGSLLDNIIANQYTEESQMIFKQLQLVLEEGERDTADVIVGKITREYLRIIEKKEAARSRVANGE